MSALVAVERRCRACGERLHALARRDRRYCDARCRQRGFAQRRREPVELVGEKPDDFTALTQAVAKATDETRLVALVAKAAGTNWRISGVRRRGPPSAPCVALFV